MNPELILQIALFAIPVIIAVTLHEAAHGFVALHFGDRTAKDAGRVTLNPIKHIDPFGTVILPLLLIFSQTGFLFGYAKPVPVNFAALRSPRWNMVWVAAAGPAMNLFLAVVSVILLVSTGAGESSGDERLLTTALYLSVQINVILAVFNMLPLPPLDGSKVLAAFLPNFLMRPYLSFGRYGMLVLLFLLIILPLLAARTGYGFDVFGPLVAAPSGAIMEWLLNLFGMAQS